VGGTTNYNVPQPYPETGPDGKPTGRYIAWDGRQRKFLIVNPPTDMQHPQGLHEPPRAGAGTTKSTQYFDPKLFSSYQTALRNTGRGAAEAQASTKAALMMSIPDPNLRKDIEQIKQDPRTAKMTPEQLIQAGVLTAPPGVDPEAYLSAASSLLRIVR
jgi:hypothetical protein